MLNDRALSRLKLVASSLAVLCANTHSAVDSNIHKTHTEACVYVGSDEPIGQRQPV